jgi:folylpolyglutamate synthase/dihydropteroate synthase
MGNSFEQSKEAYQTALKTAQKEDTVVVLGSVFLIAELL